MSRMTSASFILLIVKGNRDPKQTYVLLGAMKDGKRIIPVELVVKEFFTSESGLYVTVTLANIEDSGVVEKASAGNAAGTQSLFPESAISIRDLIKDVNADDSRLLKYFPDQMLSDEQREFKKQALERQERDYDAIRVESSFASHSINCTSPSGAAFCFVSVSRSTSF